LTKMSSMYASMRRPINSLKIRRMHHWKVAPAFLSPKSIVW
jgi:hypothetical protein